VAGVLLLVPSIGGVVVQIEERGPQTLVPSLEAGYPWLLALAATSLYAGLGIARRRLGETAIRRHRLVRGVAIGLVLMILSGTPFALAAVANDLALADSPVRSSRFGPTDPDLPVPECHDPIASGRTARLSLALDASIDARPTGSVSLDGARSGGDFRWVGYAATARTIGTQGLARIGGEAWALVPGTGWRSIPPGAALGRDLDVQLLATALTTERRAAAEDHAIAYVEGARGRHCRIAVDGATFRAAFPEIELLVGDFDLSRWRGELDYWVFADGALGQVIGDVNGTALGLAEDALLGRIGVRLTAVDRGVPQAIQRPVR
jgi:hypothetical protein